MVTLTVFTPTFNRKKLLTRCFDSLKRQSSADFKWMIIDDGSTDGTEETVASWKKQSLPFEIIYIYKENGGLHTAYNKAIENLDTQLAVCIDSDDYMPDNAVELIVNFWREKGGNDVAGIAGLDYDLQNNVIGDPFPNQEKINLIDIVVGKYKIKNGDRKLVVRSDLYKSVSPMPVYKNEKHFNPNYMHMEISKKYDFLILNQNLCYVEYQPDGMTNSMLKQYYSNPRSFAELRKQHLSFNGIGLLYTCKEYIHYISCCCLAREWCGLKNIRWPIFILCCPLGVTLSVYIKIKNRR